MAKAAGNAGSDRAELKKLLVLARKQPVHMALALGGDGKAIVKLDKLKNPRTLVKDLREEGGSKNHRFGTVMIDPDNPKLARFIVNKEIGGFARRLVVALKGTGFTKVMIVSEDGTALEDAAGEDDEFASDEDDNYAAEEDDADGQPSQIASLGNGSESQHGETTYVSADAFARDEPAGDEASGEQSATGQDGGEVAPQLDKTALAADLTGLVRNMMTVIARDPSQRAGLVQLATDAQANLKRGELEQAAAGIDLLREALDSAPSASASSQADTTAPSPDPAELEQAPAGPDPAT